VTVTLPIDGDGDGAYLPEEYMHLIGRWRHPWGI
jgi:hypothetical protein